MSLKGNLDTFFLNSIFQLLNADQKTGILKVQNTQKQVKIYFQDGDIVYATGNQKENRLGYHLQSSGLISSEQLDACLAQGKREKKALGKVLVEKGLISNAELQKVVRDQVENIIFDIFIWKEGIFEYKDARLNLAAIMATRINIVKILLEASRRVDEMAVLRKHIPNGEMVFKTSEKTQSNAEVKLSANEWRVLRLVNGKRPVTSILEQSRLDEFSVYKILYSLVSSGLIESGSTRDEKSTDKSREGYSAIITFYCDILQTISRSLEPEIGKQMIALFDRSKPVLSTRSINLFSSFNPNNPTATNIHLFSKDLEAIEDSEEARRMLISGFNVFITNILDKVPDLLGKKFSQTLHEAVENTLQHIVTYQVDSPDKHLVIEEVKKIIAAADKKITQAGSAKSKTKGLFAKLKGR